MTTLTGKLTVCCTMLLFWLSGAALAKCDRELTLGWDLWEPYQYVGDDQMVTGLDIELLTAIIENAGCSLSVLQLPWKRHLKAIENGSIDLAAGASKTPERERFARFTKSYRQERVALFLRKADFDDYQSKSIEELLKNDFRLGVTRGNFYGEDFERLMQNPDYNEHIQEVNSYILNYHKLLNNRVDGFLSDQIAGKFTMQHQGLWGQVSAHPTPIYKTDIFIMASKSSVPQYIVDALNQSLDELIDSQQYQAIINKYLSGK